MLGASGSRALAAVLASTTALLTLGGLFRVFVGYATLPSKRSLIWAAGLAGLAGLSAGLSPVEESETGAWVVWNALWIFPVISFVSKDQRTAIDDALRCAAWILMVLAFYQRWALGEAAPASALPSAQAYAAACLLLIPIALEREDWLLSCGLLVTLIWSGSVGAWLGFFTAFVLLSPWTAGIRLYAGLSGLALCMISLYGRLESTDFMERARLWTEAAGLIRARPLLGFGPGSWGAEAPAAYPLTAAAEFGIPFALAWFAGLWKGVSEGGSYKRFGIIAVLTHALWDPVLSAPAVFWLLAYCAASSIPEGSEGFEIPARWRIPVGAGIAGTGFCIGRFALGGI